MTDLTPVQIGFLIALFLIFAVRGWSIGGGHCSKIESHPLTVPSIPLTVLIVAALVWYFDGFRVYASSHIDAVVTAQVEQIRQDGRKTRLEADRIAVENCLKLTRLTAKTNDCFSKIEQF